MRDPVIGQLSQAKLGIDVLRSDATNGWNWCMIIADCLSVDVPSRRFVNTTRPICSSGVLCLCSVVVRPRSPTTAPAVSLWGLEIPASADVGICIGRCDVFQHRASAVDYAVLGSPVSAFAFVVRIISMGRSRIDACAGPLCCPGLLSGGIQLLSIGILSSAVSRRTGNRVGRDTSKGDWTQPVHGGDLPRPAGHGIREVRIPVVGLRVRISW